MSKIYLIASVVLCTLGCEVKGAKNVEVQIKTMEERTNFGDNLNTEIFMKLSKSEAVEKFGLPEMQEEFILSEMHGEFRVGIIYKYSEEERQSGSILIDESTWEKDENTWITVWYEVGENQRIPKSVLAWGKDAEF